MTLPMHLVEDLRGVEAGSVVELDGPEGHHAVVVRRLRVGEGLELTDGRGRVATGVVHTTAKRSLRVEVTAVRTQERPNPALTVVQAVPKGDRGELATELLTEIGVETIVPWAAERCVAIWRGERAAKGRAKWSATAREAAKQSRRAWHPVVEPLADTEEVAALVAAADLAVILHEEATQPLPAVSERVGSILVVVGPEGGLTEAEVVRLAEAGGRPVRLGSEVLRTSTAGLAAGCALLAATPRWRAH